MHLENPNKYKVRIQTQVQRMSISWLYKINSKNSVEWQFYYQASIYFHCALQWLANVKFIPASWILKTSSDLMKTKWKKVLKRKLNG